MVAKQFYLHALEHSSFISDVDKMIAIHNFHNAIEIVLKAIVYYYNVPLSDKFDPKFPKLIEDIDKHLKPKGVELPFYKQLGMLNTYRNQVQHNAYEPEESMMSEWQVFTHNFLADTYQKYFGIDFEKLSRLDLVESDLLRSILEKSSEFITLGSFTESVVLCSEILLRTIDNDIFGNDHDLIHFTYAFFDSEPDSSDNQTQFAMSVSRHIQAIELQLEILSLGGDLLRFNRFKQIAPTDIFNDKDHKIVANLIHKPDYPSAMFVLNFTIDTLLMYQGKKDLPINKEEYFRWLLDPNHFENMNFYFQDDK